LGLNGCGYQRVATGRGRRRENHNNVRLGYTNNGHHKWALTPKVTIYRAALGRGLSRGMLTNPKNALRCTTS